MDTQLSKLFSEQLRLLDLLEKAPNESERNIYSKTLESIQRQIENLQQIILKQSAQPTQPAQSAKPSV
jgi:hypothetical protein